MRAVPRDFTVWRQCPACGHRGDCSVVDAIDGTCAYAAVCGNCGHQQRCRVSATDRLTYYSRHREARHGFARQ